MVRTLLFTALLLLMAGRAEAEEIGSGELWLHEDVMAYYEAFQRKSGAHYFAVSTNGYDAGYSYCPANGMCRPLDGKRQALSSCAHNKSDLPGVCYIFANRNRILWNGPVHVLDHEAFLARLYGPASIEEALDERVGVVEGPLSASGGSFRPREPVWRQPAFRFPPTGFALTGDECLYAFELYQQAAVPNYFLADAGGRSCSYAVGFAQEADGRAFAEALTACEQRAAGQPCFVFAVARDRLAGRTEL